MSALGQKQTFAMQNVMSALPPKADICSALAHVRFVPIADISSALRAMPSIRRWLVLSLHFRGFHPPPQIVGKAQECAFKQLAGLASRFAFGR
jgi:hypothetical protein